MKGGKRSPWPVALLLVAWIPACSRSGSAGGADKAQPAESVDAQRRTDSPSAPRAVSGEAERCAIASIDISPLNPSRDSVVTAQARTVPADLPETVRVSYVFWLNAAKAQEGASSTFTSLPCKKNDLLYVDAILMADDGRELARRRSLMVKVVNSSPQIKNVEMPEIKNPGQYSARIQAADADGDPLRYAIEGAGLPDDIAVDHAGNVTFTVAEKSPEEIAFFAVVRDDEEGEARQEIKLRLVRKTVQGKQD